ncbi:MAG: hypothetical protein E6Q78_05135 [Rhodoferax sp.]|nr:MAG: hypothetical protein E6Q78_05135 [Rhodoferax sp.]
MPKTHADLPPVTLQHRMHAYLVIRPIGVSFEAAMNHPRHAALRKVIECKAALIRTEAWKAVHQRVVTPVRRVRLGTDGHPVGWATQMVMAGFEPIKQPELPL